MNIEKDIIGARLLEEDERIVSYLKGQMSEEEEKQFLKELDESPELKEKAIIMARLVKGLKHVGANQDNEIKEAFLASTQGGVADVAKKAISEHEESLPKREPSLRKVSLWLSIAASVVLVAYIGFSYNDYRKITGLGDEYANAFETSMITRGADEQTEAEKKLQKLFENIKTKTDLDDTLHELSLYWEISLMETYNDYTDFSSEIGWNLAIGYLKNNNREGAKIVLKKIISISEEDSVVTKKADELLEKLP